MADSLHYVPQLRRRLKTLAVPKSSDSEYFKLSFREPIRRIISTLAWLLILSFFAAPPAHGANGKVTIESGQYREFQWNDGPSYRTVPKHLPWTKAQIELAKTAIGKTESQIRQKLRQPEGAVRLHSAKSATNFSILSLAAYPEYSAKSRIQELSWFDKSGRLIGKPLDYPFEATAP